MGRWSQGERAGGTCVDVDEIEHVLMARAEEEVGGQERAAEHQPHEVAAAPGLAFALGAAGGAAQHHQRTDLPHEHGAQEQTCHSRPPAQT